MSHPARHSSPHAGGVGRAGSVEQGAVPEQRAGRWPWPGAVAVVADDLTGAMDGGVQLLPRTAVEVLVSAGGAVPPARMAGSGQPLARGVQTPPAGGNPGVCPYQDAAPAADAPARIAQVEDASVLPVINTQSRGVPPDEASARVRAICRDLSAAGRTVWFKKIDSTMRGNVGAELAALHEALAPCVIVCTPALPEEGRTVQEGVLLVAGEPAMATPYRDEIPTAHGAAASSAVIDIVRRQWPGCRAAHLPARPCRREIAAVAQGPVDLVVADAASDRDLNAFAAAAGGVARGGRRLVWAGAAGLLRALALAGAPGLDAAPRKDRDDPVGNSEPAHPAPLVLVCGSRRILSRRQVDCAAAAARPLMVRPSAAPGAAACKRWHASGGAEGGAPGPLSAADAAALSAKALAGGRDLFLCAPPLAQSAAWPSAPVAETVAADLADLAARALASAAVLPRAPLLVGGDTAYACLRRLDIRRLVLGGEAEPYVPWGRVLGGSWGGMVLVTKAGGFGDPHTLRRVCGFLPIASSPASVVRSTP